MKIDHASMESSGGEIHDQGVAFARKVGRISTEMEVLIPYFGDPGTDEAAKIFRRGQDGHPGFDGAYEDLSKILGTLRDAYEAIGTAVVSMSTNVEAADWASMVDENAFVKELVEFAKREDDEVAVPTTPVELA
ncbi:hypothetical protein FAF44_18620 [Nonomuraea sp. MG754425]|uniref:hypothetical protein n=1 Tax=Nonomuraea sp. MG754425 TaxID=2570319 RepID=UPI001F2EFC0F|nr:hypothetical protein [Nonomuraea sp. MG754425]MCF6470396.1 hypothetical protein [Nonomuraea sp. MG754425]